jgi:hypothetical protein
MGFFRYSVYTDMSPGWFKKPYYGLLLPDILALQCAPGATDVKYTWRPDYASWSGSCGGAPVSLTTGYQGNGTICSRFSFGAQPAARTVVFAGAPPNPNQTTHDVVGFGGVGDGSGGGEGGSSGGAVLTRLTM